MSAIGDYVHLAIRDEIFPGGKVTGYETGIAPEGYNQDMRMAEAKMIFRTQKTRIKQFANLERQYLSGLAQEIETDMSSVVNGTGDAQKDFEKMLLQISAELAVDIDKKLNVSIGRENLTEGELAVKKLKERWNRLQQNKESLQYQTLNSIIKELQTIIDNLTTMRALVDGTQVQQDLQHLKSIKTRLSNIVSTSTKDTSLIKLKTHKDENKQGYDILNLYKSAVNILNHYRIMRATTSDKGDVLEFLTAMISCYQEHGKYIADEKWKELMQGDPTHLTYRAENFRNDKFDFVEVLASLPTYAVQDGYVIRTGGASKDKVDVTFCIGATQAKISAKNYSKRGMLAGRHGHPVNMFGGVSGSPLLFLIQNENHSFINHWMNVTVAHPDGDIDQGLLQFAHRVMIITLIAKGIYGEVLKSKRTQIGQNIQYSANLSEKAQFLLWNDSDSGKIKVLPLGSILLHMIKQVDISPVGSYGIGESYSQSFINNRSFSWGMPRCDYTIIQALPIEQRLKALLLHMHNTKITTYISADLF